MEKRRDDLDQKILNSVKNINPDQYYTDKLMLKIKENKEFKDSRSSLQFLTFKRKLSISLILTGLFFFMISMSNVEYTLLEIQCKIKQNAIKTEIKEGSRVLSDFKFKTERHKENIN
ncbi:hypothetical protein [Hathewaya limosa]|uniref:Uncharacterized protein n=1 Tax=Hathewaya limosa TaxID=1536 RepID=A0ABU0JRZ7_HATLI|nr:hypothetical protein [Hathewaya limosa]MDQ0479867.1 hypothetical protein [Hathewaya limosa]